jgi:hypothetical protein
MYLDVVGIYTPTYDIQDRRHRKKRDRERERDKYEFTAALTRKNAYRTR